MATKTRAELKAFFETGDTPTQLQFADFIDGDFNLNLSTEPFLSASNIRFEADPDGPQPPLTHIGNMIDLVMHICSLELPVRLITLGEGAIQGFIDEIIDMEQARYTEVMAADIPGPETVALGEKEDSISALPTHYLF